MNCYMSASGFVLTPARIGVAQDEGGWGRSSSSSNRTVIQRDQNATRMENPDANIRELHWRE